MYNRFSDFYDQLVFDIDYDKYSKNILSILEKNNIKEAQILEIGCGTGNLTQKLSKQDCLDIHAFDYSEQMLNHAFQKIGFKENVQLFKNDMYKFPYEEYEYDAIITLLDVINYIVDENKLKSLFSNIYSGLRKGGVFIFDINSRYKLLEVLGDNTYVYERDNIFYTWENYREGDIIEFTLNFFVKGKNGYERVIENQTERYYSIEYIQQILENIGFKDVEYVDEDGGPFIEGKTQRILFNAKK